MQNDRCGRQLKMGQYIMFVHLYCCKHTFPGRHFLKKIKETPVFSWLALISVELTLLSSNINSVRTSLIQYLTEYAATY